MAAAGAAVRASFGGGGSVAAGSAAGPGFGGNPGGGAGFTAINLPWGELARNEAVVTVAAIGMSVTLAILLAAWLVVVLRRPAATAR